MAEMLRPGVYAYTHAQVPLSVPRMSSSEAKSSGGLLMFGRTRSDAMQSLEATEGPIGRSLAETQEPDGQDVGEEEEPTETKARAPFQAKLICGMFDERPFFPSVLFVSTLAGAMCMLTEQRSIMIDMCGSAYVFTTFFFALYFVTLFCLLYCLLSDPGQMDKRKQQEMQEAGQPMPKRSHKAWLYKRPIRRFDHYCRWVTNVIGLNNHREFMVMCGGLASIAVLGGFTDAALLLWCFTQFRFPVLVVLHLLYSAIFAKMVMPIFTIHVGFVSRSELAKDYKNDEFWVLVNQETGMSTSVKDLDVEDYNEAFDADLFTYDSSRNPWDQGWHRNCFNFWCKTRWSPEQLGDF